MIIALFKKIMKKQIEYYYRKLPNGYLRSVIKNIISFALHNASFKVMKYNFDGEKIFLYEDKLFSTKRLLHEVAGYNQKYKLKKGNIVIDAGSYSGLFSIYASKKVGPEGKVIAFEPDPYNYAIIKRNLKLNKIINVILLKKGLFDKDTIVPFDIQGISSTIVTLNGPWKDQKTINKAEVVALDNELKRLKIKTVDFIKMDIEGAEIEAVNGAKQTIKTSPNIHFAIASYHIVNEKQTREYLEKFFKKLKMKVQTSYPKHLTTYASW